MDWNFAQLILTGAGTIAVYLIGSKLFSAIVERFWKKSDAYNTALIDADQLAMKLLHGDVTALKAEVKELRAEVSDVKDERADLRAENTILKNQEAELKARVDRQGKKIETLTADVKHTNNLLAEAKSALLRRDTEVAALRNELAATTLSVHALTVEMELLRGKGSVQS